MEPYKYCEKLNRVWNFEGNECVNLNEYTCKQSGGTYVTKGPTCSEYEPLLTEFSNRCLENHKWRDWTDTSCTTWNLTKIICDELGGNTTKHDVFCESLDKNTNSYLISCEQKIFGSYSSVCKYN